MRPNWLRRQKELSAASFFFEKILAISQSMY